MCIFVCVLKYINKIRQVQCVCVLFQEWTLCIGYMFFKLMSLKWILCIVHVHVHVSVWQNRHAMALVWKSNDTLHYLNSTRSCFSRVSYLPLQDQLALRHPVFLLSRRAQITKVGITPIFMWCIVFEFRSSQFLSKSFSHFSPPNPALIG